MRQLAPYAAHIDDSFGRLHHESEPALYRNAYQRDRDRIVNTNAFRYLEYKVQLFVDHEQGLSRTRLTHSLTLSQLSRTIARSLRLNEDLTEAIALSRNLGHPPFGYAGQEALNYCMQNYGGFDHHLQSLRIIDELEERYPTFRGLNLTFETREGILEKCTAKQAKTLGQVAARFFNDPPSPPSLEAQITHLCDEIVYNQHDIEDGLHAKLISIRQLREFRLFDEHYSEVIKHHPNLSQRRIIYETIRRIVDEQITNVIETSHAQLDALHPSNIEKIRMAEEELITFSALMFQKHLELRQFLKTQLYNHYRIQRMAFKAQYMIRRLFEVFMNEVRLLPLDAQLEVRRLQGTLGADAGKARAISDYIADMPDRYAIEEYERLFNPTHSL